MSLFQNCIQDIVDAADAVIAVIDTASLAKFLVRKVPEEGMGAASRKKEAEEQKATLLEALEKKANALLDVHPEQTKQPASAAEDEVSGQEPGGHRQLMVYLVDYGLIS
jgi:hypothetical protein